MPKIWLISDWHFNHDREFVWKPRGFQSIQEMNEAIIQRHNSVVAPEDTVFVLGDCALGGGDETTLQANKELIEQLNGHLIIVRGNHDTDRRVDMYSSCKNVDVAGEYARMVKYKKYHFYISHFPTMTSNLEKETLHQCTLNIYGHTHQTTKFYEDRPYMYCVCADAHNCTPVLLDDIISDMKQKYNECLEEL